MMNLGLFDGAFLGSLSQLWTPANISTALWLDAADASTITLNGATVSQWGDKSGNGRNFSQPITANQPSYLSTGGLGGKASISIVSSRSLSGASFESGTYSWCLAHGNHTAASNFTLVGDGAVNATYLPIGQSSTNTNMVRVNNLNDPAGSLQLYDGETSQSVTTRQNVYDKLTTGSGHISQYINIPVITSAIVLPATTSFFQFLGNLGEIVVTKGSIAVSDRQRLEGYLAHKWNLTANLPSGHPYKNAPP